VWLQTGFVDSTAVLLCLPVSAWAAAILIINEVPDIEPTAARTNARSSCVGASAARVDLSRACRDRPGGLGAIIGVTRCRLVRAPRSDFRGSRSACGPRHIDGKPCSSAIEAEH